MSDHKFGFIKMDGKLKAVPLDEELQVTIQFDSVEERDYFAREMVACCWHKCSESMPYEHDSIFARFKGTSTWNKSMWSTCSDEVDITVEYPDGSRRTGTGKTQDGKWHTDMHLIEKGKVIAWRHRPAPYGGKA